MLTLNLLITPPATGMWLEYMTLLGTHQLSFTLFCVSYALCALTMFYVSLVNVTCTTAQAHLSTNLSLCQDATTHSRIPQSPHYHHADYVSARLPAWPCLVWDMRPLWPVLLQTLKHQITQLGAGPTSNIYPSFPHTPIFCHQKPLQQKSTLNSYYAFECLNNLQNIIYVPGGFIQFSSSLK